MRTELKLTERKRLDILAAAAGEFTNGGFSATSMDRVAERARVSKRTVYNHFASKERLFQAVLEETLGNLVQVTEHGYDPEVPVEIQLGEIAGQEMSLLTSNDFIALARMITAERINAPELTREAFESIEENNIGVVRWIRQAARDRKLSVADPVMAGRQFLALIKEFALWPQLYDYRPVPTKSEQKKIIESSVEMFMNMYGVWGQA